jgi:hypothetical protein
MPGSRAKEWVCAVALAVVLSSPAAWAEDEPEFPHGEFEEDCSLCHGDEAWTPVRISPEFDHADRGIPLTLSHGRVEDCRTCHSTLDFTQADPECISCHEDIHRGELGIDCAGCHTPRSFIDRIRMVRRHVETRFPLNGTHLVVDCEGCHPMQPQGGMRFVNTPWECQSCHLDAYLATSDPDHEQAGFPRECDSCHNTQSWIPASFNHGLVPPGSECADCHLDDYQGTTRPNHQTAGFPQDCEACHNTRSWIPASYRDHDQQYFPIYSGRHRGEWSDCVECHTQPDNFSTFSCLDCHAHSNESEVTRDHSEVSGEFVYDSQYCYGCHPDGRAEGD